MADEEAETTTSSAEEKEPTADEESADQSAANVEAVEEAEPQAAAPEEPTGDEEAAADGPDEGGDAGDKVSEPPVGEAKSDVDPKGERLEADRSASIVDAEERKSEIIDPTLKKEISTVLAGLNMRTVTGRLRRHWITGPEQEILIFYDDEERRTSLTNEQLQDLVEKCASYLRCNGVQKGDIVCNALDISLEKTVMDFAIMFAGAVLMDGSGIIDKGRHFWVPFTKAGVKHLVVDPNDENSMAWQMVMENVGYSYADIERASIKECSVLEKIFKFRMAHLMPEETAAKTGFELLDEHNSTFEEVISSHDPCILFIRRTVSERMYKMVMRSHLGVIQLAQRAQEMLMMTRDDVIYNDWPLSWVSGGLNLPYITTGLTIVQSTLHNCPAQRVVKETWDMMVAEDCTMAALEPQMIVMLASHCEDLPKEHLKLRAITTSGIVRPSVMDAIGIVADSVINCYAIVEAGLVSRLVVTEANRTRFSEGCVGELSDPMRTRLDMMGAGAVRPTKIGEIVLRGKLVAKEYYKDTHLTSASFTADGFLKTGDLGFYDSFGKKPYNDILFVLGRKSQAIIRGDTAIFPREIEEKVNQCPGIWKVAIVSIRDEKGVAQMCACVIPRSQDSVTIDRVKEFCRYMLGGTADDDDNPHMPTYVFFFTDFPMIGKEVDKHTLAHSTAAVVNGTDAA